MINGLKKIVLNCVSLNLCIIRMKGNQIKFIFKTLKNGKVFFCLCLYVFVFECVCVCV